MSILKETAIKTINRLPDECTKEDIMYEINFIAQVLDCLKDAKAGKTISTEELLKKVDQWSK